MLEGAVVESALKIFKRVIEMTLEINPLLMQIKDQKERTEALRGYL